MHFTRHSRECAKPTRICGAGHSLPVRQRISAQRNVRPHTTRRWRLWSCLDHFALIRPRWRNHSILNTALSYCVFSDLLLLLICETGTSLTCGSVVCCTSRSNTRQYQRLYCCHLCKTYACCKSRPQNSGLPLSNQSRATNFALRPPTATRMFSFFKKTKKAHNTSNSQLQTLTKAVRTQHRNQNGTCHILRRN